jgi:hypothetical protein
MTMDALGETPPFAGSTRLLAFPKGRTMKKANLEAVLMGALKTASLGATRKPEIEEASLGDNELRQVQGAGTAVSVRRPAIVVTPVRPLDWWFTNLPPKDPPPKPPDAGDFTEIQPDAGTPPIYHEAGPPIPWNPNPFPPEPEPWI